MAWTNYQKFLIVLLVITGSINSLATKWCDTLDSKSSDGEIRLFNHPFLQTSSMFLGEMLCFVVFKILVCTLSNSLSTKRNASNLIRGNTQFNPFILTPPAILDLIGTSLMYVGLNLTYVSSFQMFRGSIIVFTAILSVAILDKKIKMREWCGIGTIIVGLFIVGASDFMSGNSKQYGHNSIITGDLLIILAQIVSASQMVYEEKYISGLDIPPLQAVGWEGIFGFSVLFLLHIVFYFIPAPPTFGNNPRHTIEDAIDGLVQIGNNGLLLLGVLGGIFSIAFFNFAGISVTKEMSATTRMVLDSVRILFVWAISLAVNMQDFYWPQLVGFAVLLVGMCIYNNILIDRIQWCRPTEEIEEPILNSDAAEN